MVREIDNGISRVMAYFVTEPQTVDEHQDVDLEAIVASLNTQVENWNGRGSGFVVDRITRFVISVVKYRPLHGSNSCFISTPIFIERKKCTVNVKKTMNSVSCGLFYRLCIPQRLTRTSFTVTQSIEVF